MTKDIFKYFDCNFFVWHMWTCACSWAYVCVYVCAQCNHCTGCNDKPMKILYKEINDEKKTTKCSWNFAIKKGKFRIKMTTMTMLATMLYNILLWAGIVPLLLSTRMHLHILSWNRMNTPTIVSPGFAFLFTSFNSFSQFNSGVSKRHNS